MVERAKWALSLFKSGKVGPALQQGAGGRRPATIGYDAWDLFAEKPIASFAVTKLLSVFDVTLPTAKKQVLYDAADRASGGKITESNANDVAIAITKLIFGTPEFQFA